MNTICDNCTHAGGIVWRTGERGREVLLVRAKPAPHDWTLPKGHIEPGETLEETACREVREEAGVDASIVRYVGVLEFRRTNGEQVRSAYFAMERTGDVPPAETREIRWCVLAEALELVQFGDSRALIANSRD